MTTTHEMLNLIELLVDELGSEVELQDTKDLPLHAQSRTIDVLEHGADLLRRSGRDIPEVVGSLLEKVYPDRAAH